MAAQRSIELCDNCEILLEENMKLKIDNKQLKQWYCDLMEKYNKALEENNELLKKR
jgi:hypothetical protein